MKKPEQINLKLPKNLAEAAKKYAEIYGYRNIQELAAESIREKVFEDNEFDETFSDKEIDLIDNLIELSTKKNTLVSEEKLNKTLLQ
ncbi:hypothetical protein BMS3Abin17_00613 [archaeon BMS3Abin17]|nr:hypothetical protein BMS3Abin17_00613 [archaeon BMS3Abin17]HDZ60833.1 hypothetical protein [Candidatus Pacearchaeota archaeon]